MRRETARTIQLLLRRELGVRDMLQHNGLAALMGLLVDARPEEVREEVYAALHQACFFECCR